MFDFDTPITKDTTLVGVWDCTAIDPGNPKISDLKWVLDLDDPASVLPIGTEIPDTWNNVSNPLIIGTYTTVNDPEGRPHKAVGLLRKYTMPIAYYFNSSGTSYYDGSMVYNYLQGEYVNLCSDELKPLIGEVQVPWWNGSAIVPVNGKWHLFSSTEVMGANTNIEGQAWEYWKNVTGLTVPTDETTPGRIGRDSSNAPRGWWLRSMYSNNQAYFVSNIGAIGRSGLSVNYGMLPFCYIFAD